MESHSLKKSSLQVPKSNMKVSELPFIVVEISDRKEEPGHHIVVKDHCERILEVKTESDISLNKPSQPDVVSTSNEMCDICQKNKDFGSKTSVRNGNNLQDSVCICGTKSSLSVTEKDRKGDKKEKKYQCLKCDKSFKQLNHLKMHKRIHVAKRSLQCEICLLTFKHTSNLKSHMKKHYGEKNFSCELCSSSFYTKYELNIHTLKHKGERPHECTVCGDKFPIASRLKRHMTIHTGERPFQCEVCGILFREKHTLDTHMGVHLSRGPFPCDICGEEFSRLNWLTLHQKVHNTSCTYSYVPQKNKKNSSQVSTSCRSVVSSSLQISHEESQLKIQSSGDEVSVKSEIDDDMDNEICATESKEPQSCISDMPGGMHNQKKFTPDIYVECNPQPGIIEEVLSTGTSSFQNSPHEESQLEIQSSGVEVSVKSEINDNPDNKICAAESKQPQSCISDMPGGMLNQEKFTPDIYVACGPQPGIIQEVLSTGTILESQDDGKGYLIIFPKSLAERNCTLYTVCPPIDNKSQTIEDQDTSIKYIEKLESNCNLFACDNSLDSFPEQEIQIEEAVPRSKKPKKLKNSSDVIGNKLLEKRIEKIPKKKPKKIKEISVSKLCCHQCGKGFKTPSSLDVHMRSHTGERPYYCDVCGLGFKQLSHLRIHVRIHTGDRPYPCNQCDKAFTRSSHLNSHIQNIHVEGKKKNKIAKEFSVRNFYCKICDRTFIDTCFKGDHMKAHIDDIKYGNAKNAKRKFKTEKYHHVGKGEEGICEFCGYQYNNLVALQAHKRLLHEVSEKSESTENDKTNIEGNPAIPTENNKKKICPVVTFLEKSVFNIKTLDSGQYQCSTCSKTFSTRSNARVHLRVHTGARPYKCNQCRKTFRQISHLKDHTKTHRKVKPFSCSICLADFVQSSGAKLHIKKYHQGQGKVIKKCHQGQGKVMKKKRRSRAHTINKMQKDNDKQDLITFELGPESDNNALVICVGND